VGYHLITYWFGVNYCMDSTYTVESVSLSKLLIYAKQHIHSFVNFDKIKPTKCAPNVTTI